MVVAKRVFGLDLILISFSRILTTRPCKTFASVIRPYQQMLLNFELNFIVLLVKTVLKIYVTVTSLCEKFEIARYVMYYTRKDHEVLHYRTFRIQNKAINLFINRGKTVMLKPAIFL